MKKITFYATLLLLIFSFFGNAFAQNADVLKLKSGNYNLTPNIEGVRLSDLEPVKFKGKYYVYVHFSAMPTTSQKNELNAIGVELLDYVPNSSFMARINNGVNISNLSNYGIDGIYLVLPEFKMSYDLSIENYPEHAVKGKRIQLIVQNHSMILEIQMDAYYKKLGAKILSHYSYSNLTTVEVPTKNIQKLASHPLVKFLEPIAPEAVPEDIVGQSNHRSNYISNTTINSTPYNGAGVWIAIGDDGELGPHIDYTGRMDQSSVGPSGGSHGDHVSGIMMGAGNMDPKGRGMAWGADIKVYDVWDAVNSTPVSYFNPGVVVTSTSYGNGCNAGYTSFAQTADQQIRQMPNLMHVFSAGNSGSSNCGYGAGAGWGNITGGIKAGKNVIAVGNVNYLDALAGSSSRGPASDGRIKPDICANGTQVYSCQPNNTYANLSGTSMAAPGVSGTYGQLVQAYRDLNGGVTPPSALVKGTLLNTADDLGNIGPDFKYGWGRMNARRVVEVFKNNTFMVDSISQNGSKSHTITVPAGVKQLKVMVYWNDYEGSTVTTNALVNNIDMNITDPSANLYLPYVLDPTPIAANLNAPATNGVDNLNNMEQVVFDNPTAGTYTVNVSGTTIPQGPQTYYVIYEFITDEIVVTYPTGGEGFEPGTVETIRWDAVKGTNTFTVDYSLDNGVSWTTMATAVSANQRSFNWNVVSVISGLVKVRVTRNNVIGVSQMPFSIIGVPTNIQITASCPNSFEVSWNQVGGATAYEVSVLGAKYMDSVITVNGLSATVSGYPANVKQWVSVKAKTSTAVGKRAIAVQKQAGVWNCPLPNDIEVTGLMPSGNALFDCEDYSSKNISVRIKNIGTSAVTNIDLAYQFNFGSTVSGQYVGTLMPGDSVDYTFSQTESFATPGSYDLQVWKTTPDDNTYNDTVNNPFEVYTGTLVTVPYEQDFELFSSCGTASNCGDTDCNLTYGWTNVANGSWDDIDFRVDNGGTPSSGTGPNLDHKPGTSAGNYLYLEASGGCTENEAQLITPCIDLTGASAPHATMWYHMLGTSMGELHFDILVNGKWTNDFYPYLFGNQGSSWQMVDFDLTQYVGEIVNIRFRGITGDNWSSDIALDHFSVIETAVHAGIDADSMPCFTNGAVTITNQQPGIGTSFSWDFGAGATPATANTAGPHTVVYASKGAKIVTLMVSDGVVTDTATQIINLVGIAQPSFTTSYDPATDSIHFTNTSTDYASVNWDFGDGNSSTDINPVHKYAAKGYYDVVLTLTNNCGNNSLDQKVENFPLGTKDITTNGGLLSAFPNPGNGDVTLQFNEMQGADGRLVVYDVNGKLVYVQDMEIKSQNMTMKLDLTQLGKGIYVLGFTSDDYSQKIRIVIQ